MLAADLFHVGCALTLKRLYCLFVNETGSRYVHVPGETAHPDGPLTIQQIRHRARRLHAKSPLDIVVVDHIQLISGGRSGRRDEQNRTP